MKSTPFIETIFKEQKIHKVTEDCYTFGKLGRTQPGKKKAISNFLDINNINIVRERACGFRGE